MNLLINILVLLFIPFLMIGVIKKTKAFWAGRNLAAFVGLFEIDEKVFRYKRDYFVGI